MPQSKRAPSVYRDELDAAQARADSLENRLATARARVAELENPRPIPARPRPRRRVSVDRSRPYFPLLGLWLDGMRTAAGRVPTVPDPQFGSVIASVLYKLIGVPLMHAFRVLYVIHLFVLVAPWTLLLSLVLSVPVLAITLLASIRFADAPPPKDTWSSGHGDGSNYLWMLLSFAGQPLLPLFAPGWDPS